MDIISDNVYSIRKGRERMPADRNRAKALILEILRQSGGQLGKTKVFKAFWLAHLYYVKKEPGYLSDWPIVRMPHGPGIDHGDTLIKELTESGDIAIDHQPVGPYTEIVCKLTGKSRGGGNLSASAIAALSEGYKTVEGEPASKISQMSHEFSRSWNNTPNGSELNIYSDLIPDDVYEDRRQSLMDMKKEYENLFE
jgi:hypothetical protein